VSVDPYRALLAAYLRPRWGGVLGLSLLLLAGVGLELASPQLARYFIDTAVAGGALETLALAAGAYMGVALLAQVVTFGETYAAEQVGWGATNHLRLDLVRHALGLDMAFHDAHTPGELIERIDGDVTQLANFFSRFVLKLVGSSLLLVGALALLWLEEWRIGLLFLVTCALALVVLERVRAAGTRYAAARRQANAELFGFLEERLAGLVDIRANGAGGHTLSRLRDRLAEVFQTSRTAFLMGGVLGSATGAVFALGTVAALGLAAYLLSLGWITLGAVYLVLRYTGLIRQHLGEIRRQAQDFQAAEASIRRVAELRQTRPSVVDGSGEPPPPGPLSVEFSDVAFRYPRLAPDGEAPLALDGVSFRLEPGRVLGVLGRTGSGKSTLARLLARLYDPTSGQVLLGGVDPRTARLDDLRRRVGLVTQEVQLFRASLRENVTLFAASRPQGHGGVPEERVLEALEALGLGEWLRRVGGLEAEIDPAGLSAGEAQLVAFARLFLRDPGLVVLDEASSRLDPATERLLERAVDRLLRPDGARRTAIVIAHRLATLERADDVLILERGRVVEHGPRAALAADPRSRFGELLALGLEPEPVGGVV
jgi:ABC-type multidrug transport system fused ATPase/permease subunit